MSPQQHSTYICVSSRTPAGLVSINQLAAFVPGHSRLYSALSLVRGSVHSTATLGVVGVELGELF